MAIVSIFSVSHCNAEDIAVRAAEQLGYRMFTDDDIVRNAASTLHKSKHKLKNALSAPSYFLDHLPHDQEHHIAYLQCALASILQQDNILLLGYAGLLIPETLSHVLQVCIEADNETRIINAQYHWNIGAGNLEKILKADDANRMRWTQQLFGALPWEPRLYDLMLSTSTISVREAVTAICARVQDGCYETTLEVRHVLQDFQLAAQVSATLHTRGYLVNVNCLAGSVIISVDAPAARHKTLKKEIRDVTLAIPEVKEITIQFSPVSYLPVISNDTQI